MSEPAKKLVALVWAMRYEWAVCAVALYLFAYSELSAELVLIGTAVLLMLLRPISGLLFERATAAIDAARGADKGGGE